MLQTIDKPQIDAFRAKWPEHAKGLPADLSEIHFKRSDTGKLLDVYARDTGGNAVNVDPYSWSIQQLWFSAC